MATRVMTSMLVLSLVVPLAGCSAASAVGAPQAAGASCVRGVVKTITVGIEPGPIVITPNGKFAYVANLSTVTPIRTATNTALKPIKVGSPENTPIAMAITPDGKTLYVAELSDQVVPVRIATNTALKPIRIGTQPQGIAITPDGAMAYVADYDGNNVFPIRVTTDTALKPINVGQPTTDLAITPDGRTVYALHDDAYASAPGQVTAIRNCPRH